MDTNKITSDDPNVAEITMRAKRSIVTLEPALLLLFTSLSLSGTIWTNQIIYQSCTVQFGYDREECALLGTHNASKNIETIVQPYAANILMTRQLIESIVPAVLSLFIGPWSDRFGRRPVILTTMFGFLLSNCVSVFVAWLSTRRDVNPWLYVVAFMPTALTGGFCAFLTCTFCYISDVTSAPNRAMRMSFLQVPVFVGALVGNLTSSWMYRHTGTTWVFGVAALLTLLATLYVMFWVHESIQDDAADRRLGQVVKFGALFDVSLVWDMFVTCFRRREHYDRAVILLTMLAMISGIFVMNGSDTVFYMFVREKFNWTIQQFNTYDSTAIPTQVAGNVFGLYVLVRFFGVSDTSMAIVAFLSFAADYGIKATATEPWHLYAGLSVAFLKYIGSPMCRAIVANSVPSNEIGKIFALTTAMESMSSLVATPLYSYVYERTLAFYPGAFNMISAAMYVFCVFVMMLVKIIRKRSVILTAAGINYGPISED